MALKINTANPVLTAEADATHTKETRAKNQSALDKIGIDAKIGNGDGAPKATGRKKSVLTRLRLLFHSKHHKIETKPSSLWRTGTPGETTAKLAKGLHKLSMIGEQQKAPHPGNKHLEFMNGKYHTSWIKDSGVVQEKVANGLYNYVITADNPTSVQIRRDPNSIVDRITQGGNERKDFNNSRGHSSISNGQDVLYAGCLLIEEGELKSWDRQSGHYQPGSLPVDGEVLMPRHQAGFAQKQTDLAKTPDGDRMLPMDKFHNQEFEM